jgi:hypothetical protein
LSNRRSRFTNIAGDTIEFSRELILPQERHFHREAKSQKVQQQGIHRNGTNKGRKLPIKRKMT